jgi:hypothetical protein
LLLLKTTKKKSVFFSYLGGSSKEGAGSDPLKRALRRIAVNGAGADIPKNNLQL